MSSSTRLRWSTCAAPSRFFALAGRSDRRYRVKKTAPARVRTQEAAA